MTKLCKKCSKETCKQSAKYCFQHLLEHQQELRNKSVKKSIAKQKTKPKKKKKVRNEYKTISKKAWNTFAKWLKKDKDYFTCYTCHKTLPIEQAQAGHCFHRGKQRYKALDFDPKHIRLQCGGCNCFSSGQTNVFQAKLTRELGIEEVENMIWRRADEPALTIEELKEIIKKYELYNF